MTPFCRGAACEQALQATAWGPMLLWGPEHRQSSLYSNITKSGNHSDPPPATDGRFVNASQLKNAFTGPQGAPPHSRQTCIMAVRKKTKRNYQYELYVRICYAAFFVHTPASLFQTALEALELLSTLRFNAAGVFLSRRGDDVQPWSALIAATV